MELALQQSKTHVNTGIQVLLGSLFLAASAQIALPFKPVPMTMQTLAIFLLAITQGGRVAMLSTLVYLLEATLGLPVLANFTSEPTWMVGTRAGFLAGFPVAAYLIGRLIERKDNPSVWYVGTAIFLGQCVIFGLGVSALSLFVGVKSAIALGFVPFAALMVVKLLLATKLCNFCLRLRSKWC